MNLLLNVYQFDVVVHLGNQTPLVRLHFAQHLVSQVIPSFGLLKGYSSDLVLHPHAVGETQHRFLKKRGQNSPLYGVKLQNTGPLP